LPELHHYRYASQCLRYGPESGLLFYRSLSGEKLAGTVSRDGYVMIGVLGCTMFAHRIAWFIHFNEMPPEIIDHIDGVRHNNRIAKLQSVTASENRLKANPPGTGYNGHLSAGKGLYQRLRTLERAGGRIPKW